MRNEPFISEAKRAKKPIPHSFVLENLALADAYTRPMFGCTSVYIEEKIFFVLREKEGDPRDNGVWLATSTEHHASLKTELPSLRSISIFGETSNWRLLPSDSVDFEESVARACELILKGDPRIGRVPGSRRVRSQKKKKV